MNDNLNSLTKSLTVVQVDGYIFAREFLPTDQIELVEELNRAALDYQYPAAINDNQSSRFLVVSISLYGEYLAFQNSQPMGESYSYRDWLLRQLAILYQEASDEDCPMVVLDRILAVEGQLSVLYGIDTSPNSPLWDVLPFNQAEVA